MQEHAFNTTFRLESSSWFKQKLSYTYVNCRRNKYFICLIIQSINLLISVKKVIVRLKLLNKIWTSHGKQIPAEGAIQYIMKNYSFARKLKRNLNMSTSSSIGAMRKLSPQRNCLSTVHVLWSFGNLKFAIIYLNCLYIYIYIYYGNVTHP